MKKKTLYEILGVDSSASLNDIKAAYSSMVEKYGQDSSEEARSLMSILHEAYTTLSNSRLRSSYDARLAAQAARQTAATSKEGLAAAPSSSDEPPKQKLKIFQSPNIRRSVVVGAAAIATLLLAVTGWYMFSAKEAAIEITSDCSLKGTGEAQCTFKNIGAVKGNTCEHFVLVSTGERRFPFVYDAANVIGLGKDFAARERAEYVALKAEADAYLIQKTNILLGAKSEKANYKGLPISSLITLLNDETQLVSDNEICSGLVEAGDIRQVTGLMGFDGGDPPHETCDGGSGTWADWCSFKMIKREELEALVIQKLQAGKT